MAELAAAVRLVYRCDAALLIVRQWLVASIKVVYESDLISGTGVS
ncbi:hypothetical protein [Mycobacteroides abscessus]|nr:hypothetical protein [Mycobacteroides abscessus]